MLLRENMEILLYSARGSNSSERVEWLLNIKNIQYRKIEVGAEELKASYLEVNPFGYVPSLSIDGYLFSESMAISEYIEERFPSPALLGSNLIEKTNIRRVCEYVNASIHSPQNRTVLRFFRPELDEDSKRKLRAEWIETCLQKLSSTICKDTGYTIGHGFSLADIFVASIYKKSLQHGGSSNLFYNNHLMYIRRNKEALAAEPKA